MTKIRILLITISQNNKIIKILNIVLIYIFFPSNIFTIYYPPTGPLVGWQYTCPKGLSYDPVGGICNWAAGLGCKD